MLPPLVEQLFSKISEASSARLTTHRFLTYFSGALFLTVIAVLAISKAETPASVKEAAIYTLGGIVVVALGGGTYHDTKTRKSAIEATEKVAVSASQDLARTSSQDLPVVRP